MQALQHQIVLQPFFERNAKAKPAFVSNSIGLRKPPLEWRRLGLKSRSMRSNTADGSARELIDDGGNAESALRCPAAIFPALNSCAPISLEVP